MDVVSICAFPKLRVGGRKASYLQKKRATASEPWPFPNVSEALCSFHGAGVKAQQVADRAVLDYGRADRDETYKAQISDRTLISQEVHERKDGQSDYDPHNPFC